MTDELTSENLDELERLLAQATPGAWKTWGLDVMADAVGDSNVANATLVARGTGPRTFDINLICQMQRALPSLIAAARELSELKSALEFLDEQRGNLDVGRRVVPVNAQNVLALAAECGWAGHE